MNEDNARLNGPASLDDPVSNVPVVKTERLVLRPFRLADAEDVFAYCKDPRISYDIGWRPHESIDDSAAFIRDVASQGFTWAIVCPAATDEAHPDGTVIGSIGLVKDPSRNHDRALRMESSIGHDWWGNDYIAEALRHVTAYAFENLDIDLVTSTCYPWNTGSRHVFEKCGFTFEGMRRGADLTDDGRLEDFRCYSLTRTEWQAERA